MNRLRRQLLDEMNFSLVPIFLPLLLILTQNLIQFFFNFQTGKNGKNFFSGAEVGQAIADHPGTILSYCYYICIIYYVI